MEQWKITGIREMERSTEHQQLWPRAFAVDNLMPTLRVVVQMYEARQGRYGVVIERVRVTGREQHNITVLNPYWLSRSFNLQVGSTKAKDMEHTVLARRKIIPPRRR